MSETYEKDSLALAGETESSKTFRDIESDHKEKMNELNMMEVEMRNLKLLRTVKRDFGSLENFKKDRLENLEELKDLKEFMASIGEEDRI